MSNKKDFKNILNTFTGVGEQPQQEEPRPELNTEHVEIVEEPAAPKEEADIIDTVKDEELRRALIAKRKEGRGRPRKNAPDGRRSDGYARFTLIADTYKMAKVKEIAFQNTLTQKEVFEEALNLLIEKYEAIHGEVIPQPTKYKGDVKRLFD